MRRRFSGGVRGKYAVGYVCGMGEVIWQKDGEAYVMGVV